MSDHWNTHKPGAKLTEADVRVIRELGEEYQEIRQELRDIRKRQAQLRQQAKRIAPKALALKFDVHETSIHKVQKYQSFFNIK